MHDTHACVLGLELALRREGGSDGALRRFS